MFNKKFWKYFFNTLKESKWLLLRYFIVGIYLIVVGIISNRLKLNDLTYYNSMITLMFAVEMISFAFNEGFGIYINQHINEPEKSKKYAKIGFYFTTTITIVFLSILAFFPNFILKQVLNLNFEVNLTFYYLMIVSMFFNAIYSYFSHLLKKVGEFKFQTIETILQSALIVFGLILITIFGKLMLIPIAIIYISSNVISVIFSHFELLKCKTYSINLLKFEKLHLSKQELKTVTLRALSEVVWEVGYVFISLYILKTDVIVYNQYCYFENALDILNGMFFAFVSVVSIKLCRAIGEDQKEEAYEHGKNSIKATFVIWFAYALVSLALYIPLKYGMNIELRSTALVSLILFLIVALFRFTEWNIGTYVLGQSEYFSKAGLILETIFMCYWITLYLIADLLPNSVYLIYTFIAAENIIKTAISLYVFKNKKWIQKSE